MAESLVDAILRKLPAGSSDELKKNIKALIEGQLEQMNVVTREQLEIQEKILSRTRKRLEELESRVADMEKDRGTS